MQKPKNKAPQKGGGPFSSKKMEKIDDLIYITFVTKRKKKARPEREGRKKSEGRNSHWLFSSFDSG